MGTVTILDVGTACGGAIDGSLKLTPDTVSVFVGGTSTVFISGGSGTYVATSKSGGVSAATAGSVLTLTGVVAGSDEVTVVDVADATKSKKINVTVVAVPAP